MIEFFIWTLKAGFVMITLLAGIAAIFCAGIVLYYASCIFFRYCKKQYNRFLNSHRDSVDNGTIW